jgi:succinate dehydrogenase / fumarate reductase, membrane anchor subunit
VSLFRSNALARAFGGGAKHAASRHWCVQRFTAVILVPLSVWFLASLLMLPDFGYFTVHAWLALPRVAVMLGLLVVFLCWHSWLGVQVVIEDYVHGHGICRASLRMSTLLHLTCAVVALVSIVRVATGA